MGAVRSFFDFLAKMGLTVRDDPPKKVELAGRQWGPQIDGFALSAAPAHGIISVVLRNLGNQPRLLLVPDFATWFLLTVEGAELSPFGLELLRSAGAKPARPVTLGPAETLDAEIPIDCIYRLKRNTSYSLRVCCSVLPDIVAVSNKIIFLRES